ncbi:MAG: type II toxin-antitoxin system RelE/ParE family toxin [Thauera sp.]|nr:type II toxin-antitoxin system RelE/ParE family toxin [Thauera sp.]
MAQDPDIGDKKKGDLSQLWVYKFRCLGQLYLLGYTRDNSVQLVYLEAVGPHENFYRDLKRQD